MGKAWTEVFSTRYPFLTRNSQFLFFWPQQWQTGATSRVMSVTATTHHKTLNIMCCNNATNMARSTTQQVVTWHTTYAEYTAVTSDCMTCRTMNSHSRTTTPTGHDRQATLQWPPHRLKVDDVRLEEEMFTNQWPQMTKLHSGQHFNQWALWDSEHMSIFSRALHNTSNVTRIKSSCARRWIKSKHHKAQVKHDTDQVEHQTVQIEHGTNHDTEQMTATTNTRLLYAKHTRHLQTSTGDTESSAFQL